MYFIKFRDTLILAALISAMLLASSCSKKGMSYSSIRQMQTASVMDKHNVVNTKQYYDSTNNEIPENIIIQKREKEHISSKQARSVDNEPTSITRGMYQKGSSKHKIKLNKKITQSDNAPITVKTKPASNSDDNSGCLYILLGILIAVGLVILFLYAITITSVFLITISLIAFVLVLSFMFVYAITDL